MKISHVEKSYNRYKALILFRFFDSNLFEKVLWQLMLNEKN